MPVTMEQVRARLEQDEPNYHAAAAELGFEALPHLLALVKEADSMSASKAAYLAALIRGPQSAEVLAAAASNPDPVVRVAAAGALRDVPALATGDLLTALLSDQDYGVCKLALKAVCCDVHEPLRGQIEKIAQSHEDATIRQLSRQALERIDRLRSGPALSAPKSYESRPAVESEAKGFGGGSPEASSIATPSEREAEGLGGGDLGLLAPSSSARVGSHGGGQLRRDEESTGIGFGGPLPKDRRVAASSEPEAPGQGGGSP
jgi:hypothetical protein